MSLMYSQIEMAVSLLAKSFSLETDENKRRKMVIDFEDAFSGTVSNWKELVEKELNDKATCDEFLKIANRASNRDITEDIVIESLSFEDFEQMSYLGSKELGLMPWIPDEDPSAKAFVDSGFSFVAKQDDIIVGFILAYKCPVYGGYEYIYIDTFVVGSFMQGQGVGRLLFDRVRKEAHRNGIYGLRLMTKKDMPAYDIYKHLGFEDTNDYVHMKCY